MITLLAIKKALTGLLKEKFTTYKVHFDNVDKSDAPYFYVELRPSSQTVDRVLSDRSIAVSLQLVLPVDDYGRIKRAELYTAADELDRLFRPVVPIEDRFITVMETRVLILDDILHFTFTLDFADGLTDAELGGIAYDLMGKLGLELSGKDLTEEE